MVPGSRGDEISQRGAAALRRPRRAGRGRAFEWRDGTGSGNGTVPADRRSGADRSNAARQRLGRDGGDRSGHQPVDREPDGAEDATGGDWGVYRANARGGGITGDVRETRRGFPLLRSAPV